MSNVPIELRLVDGELQMRTRLSAAIGADGYPGLVYAEHAWSEWSTVPQLSTAVISPDRD